MIVSSVPYSHLGAKCLLLLSVVEFQNILARTPSNTARSRKGGQKTKYLQGAHGPDLGVAESTVSIARSL